jgi:alcohol dehydrogenase (quinone), cytochrome c subunit
MTVAALLCGFGVLAALGLPMAAQAAVVTNTEGSGGKQAQLERGRYLATAGDCVSCHTRPGGAPFAGGLSFSTPFGVIYSSNITPDPATGIGKWTSADLNRAMHDGIGRGGYRLFPAFPYPSFTHVADDDVYAIYAYLRSIAPVRYTPPSNSFLFHLRWGMRIWDWLFLEAGRFQPDTSRSPEWNRGAYLVSGLGHCGACHTPRNRFMAEIGSEAYAGGSFSGRVAGDRVRRWSAVNLTSSHSGLGAWSLDELMNYLKNGFAATRAGTFGPMNDVILNSLMHLSNDDVQAIAIYLKSLPPQQLSDATVPEQSRKAGAAIYRDACADCHDSSGSGDEASAPPLAGSAVVQNSDPASLINIVLYGPDLLEEVSYDDWMRPYKDTLNDAQIAALINFVRGSWGNRAPAVTAADIAHQR